MNKDYEKKFHQEIDKVLSDLWKEINRNHGRGTGNVDAEKWYIDYLEEHEIVRNLHMKLQSDRWSLELTSKGHEILVKYGGWINYYKEVIKRQARLDKANERKKKYWLLVAIIPVLIWLLSKLF